MKQMNNHWGDQGLGDIASDRKLTGEGLDAHTTGVITGGEEWRRHKITHTDKNIAE
jgi:hypothetical protein